MNVRPSESHGPSLPREAADPPKPIPETFRSEGIAPVCPTPRVATGCRGSMGEDGSLDPFAFAFLPGLGDPASPSSVPAGTRERSPERGR